MDAKYILDGFGGKRIEVYEDKVILVNGGVEKTILMHNIVAVEFKPCSGLSDGSLLIRTANDVIGNSSAELDKTFFGMQPGVTFRKKGNEMASRINEYLNQKIAECSKQSTTIVQQTSAADELKKFKELLDSGIITQEEFDAKKKQLLGL